MDKLLIIIVVFFFNWPCAAQISPGPLTRAHSDLEGMSNCTQCHTLGEKVGDDKCLNCHTEIRSRVRNNQGYHASREVTTKTCADCHSEHHGLKFDMTRFDEASFNHNLTGYNLTGQHRTTDCRQCHKPDNIEDSKLRRRSETYLGLSQACIACHEDQHQGTLSNKCANCHTTDAFAPASRFIHTNTDFPLTGKHTEVGCAECHRQETRNGKPFQVFDGVPFANCNSCHQDVHQNNLGSDCKSCHVEQSFAARTGLRRFNHSRTDFPLRGAHQQVNCAACHNLDLSATRIFQDRLGVRTSQCNTCHNDVHDGRFGLQCADCHNEKSFRQIDTDAFNHALTDFALKGQHAQVDCKQCHTAGNFTTPVAHNTCATCHSDYHLGEFVRSTSPSPDCTTCHIEDGFTPSTFTLEQHQQAGFALTGAHLATPCFACHLQDRDNKWHFKSIGSRCIDCHTDVHAGQISEKHYPQQSCERCHSTDSWVQGHSFEHSTTGFALKGVHSRTACSACHLREEPHPYGQFKGLATQCAACHDDVHKGQFARQGQTDCAQCHEFESWAAPLFDHSSTRFPLEGRHAVIACSECHKKDPTGNDNAVVYKIERFECRDCHQ